MAGVIALVHHVAACEAAGNDILMTHMEDGDIDQVDSEMAGEVFHRMLKRSPVILKHSLHA